MSTASLNKDRDYRVVIITGAASGIGASTTRRCAREGWKVCLNYSKSESDAFKLADELRAEGCDLEVIKADVSNESDVVSLFQGVKDRWGRLDGLVNNAGILDHQCRVEEITQERLSKIFAVNVIGAFLCCREAIKLMGKHRGGQGGSIVNVSSAAARLGGANEYVDYAASKGAIDTLTRGLAAEVAETGVRVNAVRPAYIHTRIHELGGEPDRIARLAAQIPMKRGGTPEEVASMIHFLLTNEASYVTGSIVDMAGGR